MDKLRLPAIILAVVGLIYLLSSPGINACFRAAQKGTSPTRGRIVYFLSNVCISTFRYGQAVRILEVALDKYPGHASARNGLYNYGLCLERLGRSNEAIAAYQQYLSKYPEDSRKQKVQNKIEKLVELETTRADFYYFIPPKEELRS